MNSVGIFCEGEINGKQFLIFTSSSSVSGEATINSGDDNDLPLQPLFLCPSSRVLSKAMEDFSQARPEVDILDLVSQVDISPFFLSQHIEHVLDSNICKLPLLPIFWCNNIEPSNDEFNCGLCLSNEQSSSYYFCGTCDRMFHKDCVESPLIIKHPFYPFQSFQLYSLPFLSWDFKCFYCKQLVSYIGYHCPTIKLTMHMICAMKPILIVIDHPKRHPHSLKFFPKQNYLPCNVCGLIQENIPTYICRRCFFVVHQDCIYFPNVIRISRHHHRISLIYPLPCGKWSCGVCRKKIDNNFGAYSCNKCDDYFVHPSCALLKDLWDGKDLEGVPEEPEVIVEPYMTITNGIILHFSHGHRLKLEKCRVYDEGAFCQACISPIYEGYYYSCMEQCDFILHEKCANSPLKKQHPLYARSLTLKVLHDGKWHGLHLQCDICSRKSYGFYYEEYPGRFIDLKCASVSEPFEYEGHAHPLYLALAPEVETSTICKICNESAGKDNRSRKLNCIECDYIICFKCATLPYKARYKHDDHFLTFYEAEKENEHSEWCDVCEKKIADSTKKGFYSCDECCTTLHIDCLLGKNMYMKPGHTIKLKKLYEFHILRNNTMSRPACFYCEHLCQDKLVFEHKNFIICSVSCLLSILSL